VGGRRAVHCAAARQEVDLRKTAVGNKHGKRVGIEGLQENSKTWRFRQAILPHLDAAYNLARWLVRNEHDAQDVAQEAYLRALTFFDSFHGEDGRGWLLAIVRNTCYTWLRKNRAPELALVPDMAADHANPEQIQMQKSDAETLRKALDRLPAEFREVLVLRELEGLSYKQLARIMEIPMGTVMSRLARARKRLLDILKEAGAAA
jgi:RNA polymerase sigma-70 factor (ECF subfamily)